MGVEVQQTLSQNFYVRTVNLTSFEVVHLADEFLFR